MKYKEKLTQTIEKLMAQPKGILAIDESIGTCNKRFEALNVPTTEEKRRDFRQMLVTTPHIEDYVSGYILFDETIRQSTVDGISFAQVLQDKGIEVGIKVDTGKSPLPFSDGESITEGLDGLRDRLMEYRDSFGATFTKWRAELLISDDLPSDAAMLTNAHALARYAALCQEEGLVPIVEPELMMTGDHSIDRCYQAMAENFDILFGELIAQNVWLPGIIIKSPMVIDGKDSKEQSSPEKIAEMTVDCFKEYIPEEVGGVVFLSGGQSPEQARENLYHVGLLENQEKLPWEITFSFGRAIQQPALEYWAQNPQDHEGAQKLLHETAKQNGHASVGKKPE